MFVLILHSTTKNTPIVWVLSLLLLTVKLNYKVSSPWQLYCQVLPTAPKFGMACHGSGSRSHFPPPSAAQRLSVSRSRSGRCFSIMIPCLCQLASHGSTEDDRCCSHIVSAPCPPPPDIDPVATTRCHGQRVQDRELAAREGARQRVEEASQRAEVGAL